MVMECKNALALAFGAFEAFAPTGGRQVLELSCLGTSTKTVPVNATLIIFFGSQPGLDGLDGDQTHFGFTHVDFKRSISVAILGEAVAILALSGW